MRRSWQIALLAATIAAIALPAFSHLEELVAPRSGGAAQLSRWDFSAFSVQWNLSSSPPGSNVHGNRSVADVIQSSFNTWAGAPNTVISVSRGADTSASGAAFDGVNLICFVCSGDFNKEAETLAVTTTTTADAPGEATKHGGTSSFAGQILDADIIFNPSTQYTTDGTGGGQDLQTVATHEIGHFFGLDHSGVVRAIMFPFAPDVETSLSYDDVAGISTLYPKGSPDVATGSISGVVTMNGAAVFGAHVYADSTSGNEPFAGFRIRKSPISTLTLPDGTYTITGLPPDSYTVAAEPLDGPETNDDVSDYPPVFGKSSVQTGFTTRWH